MPSYELRYQMAPKVPQTFQKRSFLEQTLSLKKICMKIQRKKVESSNFFRKLINGGMRITSGGGGSGNFRKINKRRPAYLRTKSTIRFAEVVGGGLDVRPPLPQSEVWGTCPLALTILFYTTIRFAPKLLGVG